LTRIGPAGWAYKDWYGVVYPAKKPRGFHEAAFLAGYFNTIEINVSFYRPFSAKSAEGWLKQVEYNRDFRFTAKLWRGFTHERTATVVEEIQFKDGIRPLAEAGRLGALLLQFPWSFRNSAENREYVLRLKNHFIDYPLILEVRHESWSEPGVIDFLNSIDIGMCNIDQPLFQRSLKPGSITTSAVGYVRLHGRNYAAWFTENSYPGERYDYLYSPDELQPWIDRIKVVEQSPRDTYVITNNHYLGKGIVNATEILSILKGEPVEAPASLLERYPELGAFVTTVREVPAQLDLI
jgi:uncharacterized protein YecE (DUF72 family)